MIAKNKTRKEICEYYDIKIPTLNVVLRRYKLTNKNNGKGKLNLEKAKEIRRLYKTDEWTQQALADKFNVSLAMIWKVVNNQSYITDMDFGGKSELKIGYKS